MTALSPSPPRPLRKSARRLRWFLGAFAEQLERTAAETGNAFESDNGALAEVFATWLKDFEAQKPTRVEDKTAYVGFAAGLMLRALIRLRPVRVLAKPAGADESNPAYFWPEGYLYVAFCLNVRGLVLEQDFQDLQTPSDAKEDIRTWWSFKENTSEDPGLAIAFLDLFAGEDPEWTMPSIFRAGRDPSLASPYFLQVSDGDEQP